MGGPCEEIGKKEKKITKMNTKRVSTIERTYVDIPYRVIVTDIFNAWLTLFREVNTANPKNFHGYFKNDYSRHVFLLYKHVSIRNDRTLTIPKLPLLISSLSVRRKPDRLFDKLLASSENLSHLVVYRCRHFTGKTLPVSIKSMYVECCEGFVGSKTRSLSLLSVKRCHNFTGLEMIGKSLDTLTVVKCDSFDSDCLKKLVCVRQSSGLVEQTRLDEDNIRPSVTCSEVNFVKCVLSRWSVSTYDSSQQTQPSQSPDSDYVPNSSCLQLRLEKILIKTGTIPKVIDYLYVDCCDGFTENDIPDKVNTFGTTHRIHLTRLINTGVRSLLLDSVVNMYTETVPSTVKRVFVGWCGGYTGAGLSKGTTDLTVSWCRDFVGDKLPSTVRNLIVCGCENFVGNMLPEKLTKLTVSGCTKFEHHSIPKKLSLGNVTIR